MQHVLAALK